MSDNQSKAGDLKRPSSEVPADTKPSAAKSPKQRPPEVSTTADTVRLPVAKAQPKQQQQQQRTSRPKPEVRAMAAGPVGDPASSRPPSAADRAFSRPKAGAGIFQPAGQQPTATPPVAKPARRTRKARLRLARIDPWSVMKTAFLFAIAFGLMLWVSVYVVWSVVESSGFFESLNNVLNTALGNPDGSSNFHLEDYLNTGRILGYTALLSVLNIVIITALATLFSFLYNLAATVLGGLEVTLAED